MELIEKTISELNLADEQAAKIKDAVTQQITALKNVYEQNNKSNVMSAYSNVDTVINEITGIQKAGEKTSEYAKKAINEFVNQKVSVYEQKIQELEKSGKVDENIKKELEEYRANQNKFHEKLSDTEKLWQKKYAELEETHNKTVKLSKLEKVIPNNWAVDAELMQLKIETDVNALLNNPEIEIVETEQKEIVIRNKSDFSQVNAKDFFTEKYKKYLKTDENKGFDTNIKDLTKVEQKVTGDNMNEKIRTAQQLLASKGIMPFHKEYKQELDKLLK